ncbi:MAG TPA: hypothetical protein VGT41_04040 [Candidatus Babeliales bacterium]|nr:hypothetical protein [Candidatus Babeliales bacterium]
MVLNFKKMAFLALTIITTQISIAECYSAKTKISDLVDMFMAEGEAQELCKCLRALNIVKDRLQKENQSIEDQIATVQMNLREAVEKYQSASDKAFSSDIAEPFGFDPAQPVGELYDADPIQAAVVLLGNMEEDAQDQYSEPVTGAVVMLGND